MGTGRAARRPRTLLTLRRSAGTYSSLYQVATRHHALALHLRMGVCGEARQEGRQVRTRRARRRPWAGDQCRGLTDRSSPAGSSWSACGTGHSRRYMRCPAPTPRSLQGGGWRHGSCPGTGRALGAAQPTLTGRRAARHARTQPGQRGQQAGTRTWLGRVGRRQRPAQQRRHGACDVEAPAGEHLVGQPGKLVHAADQRAPVQREIAIRQREIGRQSRRLATMESSGHLLPASLDVGPSGGGLG